MKRRRAFAGGASLLVVLVTGCVAERVESRPTHGEVSRSLTVFAAASLTEAFTDLGERFEGDHPGTDVAFHFAASSSLARQILDGSTADVFASADEATMTRVTNRGETVDPKVFAVNRPEILVGKGNPERIRGLADLAEPGIVLALCAPEVPCGRLAAEALDQAGVAVAPASLEENVKAVVSRVILGEADAGIVYVTDAKAAGHAAEGVPIDTDVETAYPIAAMKNPHNPASARAWLDFVLGDEGQAVLRHYGFTSP